MKVTKFHNVVIVMTMLPMLSIPALSQPIADTLWTRTFAGNGNDIGYCVQQTRDGGYVISGCTGGQWDVWLIKTDSLGNEQWSNTYGGYATDIGYSVQETIYGGYVIAGYTESYGAGNSDVLLVRTDAFGNELWHRTYGGTGYDVGMWIQNTADGGHIIVGYTDSFGAGANDVWLIKTDGHGDVEWDRTYGGSDWDRGYEVQQTTDGGYIIAGYNGSIPALNYDFWLLKTDSQGNEQWNNTFGANAIDWAYSAQQTSDGGYITAGIYNIFLAGSGDYWLIKTDSLGNEQWNRLFGGTESDYAYKVRLTEDGGYVLVGRTFSYGAGETDLWLVRTDSVGLEMWNYALGGTDHDKGYDIQQTRDGGFIVTGCTSSFGSMTSDDVWLVKIHEVVPILSVSPDTLLFSANLGGNNPDDQTFQIDNIGSGAFNFELSEDLEWLTVSPANGGPIPPTATITVSVDITGLSAGSYEGDIEITAPNAMGNPDTVHVILSIEGAGVSGMNDNGVPIDYALYSPFPNPFNPITTLNYDLPVSSIVVISIYDITGRRVTTLVNEWQNTGTHKVIFDGSNLASGIYFYWLETQEFTDCKKMVLIK